MLKHLTVKRPVEASRMDFFAHAEAFASLVNLEFVSIRGEYQIRFFTISDHEILVSCKFSTKCYL